MAKVTLYSAEPLLREVSFRGLAVSFSDGVCEVEEAEVAALLETFPFLSCKKGRPQAKSEPKASVPSAVAPVAEQGG